MSLSTMPPTWMYRGIGHDIALPDPPRRLGYALVANATNHQEPPTTKKHHPLQHLWEHPFPAKIGHVSQCRVPPSPSNSTSSSPHKVMLMFHSSTLWSCMFDTPMIWSKDTFEMSSILMLCKLIMILQIKVALLHIYARRCQQDHPHKIWIDLATLAHVEEGPWKINTEMLLHAKSCTLMNMLQMLL